jgi:hypothetical protein
VQRCPLIRVTQRFLSTTTINRIRNHKMGV